MKHHGPISGIAAFGQDWVATAGYDNRVILWDQRDGTAVARGFHDHLANQCAFSPDGRFLVSASSDYTARVWSLPELRLVTVLRGHEDDVEMAVFSPDSRHIATCSRDCKARVFALDGSLLGQFDGHEADVISVAWNHAGSEIITSSDDGTVRRWDVVSGRQIGTADLNGVETDTIVIARDGSIFAGDDTGAITLIRDGASIRFLAHNAGIKRLVLSNDGERLASLSYDRKVIIWRLAGEGLEKIGEGAMPAVVWPRSAAFLGDGTLAFATFGSTYARYQPETQAWDIAPVAPYRNLNAVLSHGDNIYAIGDAGHLYRNGELLHDLGSLCNFLTPFGRTIVAGGQMGIIFDALSNRVLHQHRSPLNCGASFTVDGTDFLIIGTYTGEGLVFRLDGDGVTHHVTTIQLHENAVKGVTVAGDRIFSVSATGGAAMHDIRDFRETLRLPQAHDRIANGCAGLPDGRFASISRDLTLRIWTGDQSEVVASPHRNSIKSIAADPSGRWIATGSYGGSIAVYDLVAKSWLPVTKPTTWGIASLSATATPGVFLAGSYDGTVHEIHADARSGKTTGLAA